MTIPKICNKLSWVLPCANCFTCDPVYWIKVTHHFSQGSNNIQVVIESGEVKRHVAIVLGYIDALLSFSDKMLYGTAEKQHTHNQPFTDSFQSSIHGRKPILAASWIGVNSRKLSRDGSAPASSKMETDSFFCANTAQWRAVSPSES